jgi:hypothetical protein
MGDGLSVITIGVDPTIEVGPLTLAWHGITIALGILIGAVAAGVEARRRGLSTAPLYAIGVIVVAGALIGGRAFYLGEHDHLLDPGEWIGARGFTLYGGMIAAALGIGVYLRTTRRATPSPAPSDGYDLACDCPLGGRALRGVLRAVGLRHGCARSGDGAVDQPRPRRHRRLGGDAHH